MNLLWENLNKCLCPFLRGLNVVEKNIVSYKGTATGIRCENPLSLEKIIFEVRVKSDNIAPENMDKTLAIAENISPVWLAIKNNVEVKTEYKIFS